MTPPPFRKIIHIDMDAFYASVEQRDDPRLQGQPLAVGFAAKRGVVAAASYEARKFGVRSAMPMSTALRLCPHLVIVPPRGPAYRAASQQFHRIFADYTSLIEPLSLDEAYLDVTENRRGLPSATATAREIRARIAADLNLTASAGISYNKFLAKLASDHRKPNGQFTITQAMAASFIDILPIAKFHGVGPVTAQKMQSLGIQTGADLRACGLVFLQRHFGKSGAWYHDIARGEDHRAVEPHRPRKSMGSETTFGDDLTDKPAIEAQILAMAAEVWQWCARRQEFGRTVTIKIKYADFQRATRSQSMAAAITSPDLLNRLSLDLAQRIFPLRAGVRLVGVSLSNFAVREPLSAQLDLALD